MTLPEFVFFLFAAVCVAAAVMVIVSKNPVYSVLYLILAFFNAAGLFVLIGAEFLAMVLVVVYVGAVAVLFLFVVMMLDVNFASMRQGTVKYLPVGALIGLVLFVELVLVVGGYALAPEIARQTEVPIAPITRDAPPTPTEVVPGEDAAETGLTNIEQIGAVLYTDYVYLFQLAGLILLVAIIGAISLTLRSRGGIRRQDIGHQVMLRREERLQLRDVKPGSGL